MVLAEHTTELTKEALEERIARLGEEARREHDEALARMRKRAAAGESIWPEHVRSELEAEGVDVGAHEDFVREMYGIEPRIPQG